MSVEKKYPKRLGGARRGDDVSQRRGERRHGARREGEIQHRRGEHEQGVIATSLSIIVCLHVESMERIRREGIQQQQP